MKFPIVVIVDARCTTQHAPHRFKLARQCSNKVGRPLHNLVTTDHVKFYQTRFGSRAAYAKQESGPIVHSELGPEETEFIASQDAFFLGSLGENGWPYIQHRGGPAGFVKALDSRTVGFPEFPGNRQYISYGNIRGNDRVSLFFVDFPLQGRLKLLGHARLVEKSTDPELIRRLEPAGLEGKIERGVIVNVAAYDWNCSKYITPRYTAEQIESAIAPLKQRIAELEQQLAEKS